MNGNRDDFDFSNDPLDHWLAKADFPTVPAASTERLRRQWRTIWTVRPQSFGVFRVAAAAAMVCLTTAVGWKLWQGSQSSQPAFVAKVEPARVEAVRSQPPTAAVEHTDLGALTRNSIPSRSPTALEMRILAAVDRRAQKVATKPQVSPDDSVARKPIAKETQTLGEPDVLTLAATARSAMEPNKTRIKALSSLLENGDENAISIYLSLAADPATAPLAMSAADDTEDPPTAVLLRKLSDQRVSTRMTAAAVLGRIDGPETTRELVEMVLKNVNRREALFALAASHGPEARAFLNRAAKTNELASAVASTMIQTEYQ